jgi:hypothetical protein
MDGAGTGRVFTAPVVRDYGDLLAITADSGLMHVGVSGPSAALVSAPAAPGDALGDGGQPGGGESLPGGGGQSPGGETAGEGAGGAGGGASGDGLPFTGFAAAAVGAAGAALASAGAAARRALRRRG